MCYLVALVDGFPSNTAILLMSATSIGISTILLVSPPS